MRSEQYGEGDCHCHSPEGVICRYEDALFAGTMPPEYFLERMPALLYKHGSIYIHNKVSSLCLFGRN